MMSCICDYQWDALRIYGCQNTPCMPGIKLAIAEDDVWYLHKVFRRIFAPIVVENPIELRFFVVRGTAPCNSFIRRPSICWEHSSSAAGKWLRNFIAVKHVPAVLWNSLALRWGRCVKAFSLIIVIVKSTSSSCQSIEVSVFVAFMLFKRF